MKTPGAELKTVDWCEGVPARHHFLSHTVDLSAVTGRASGFFIYQITNNQNQ